MLSPVIIFAYNRPHLLRRLLADLEQCRMIEQSPVYIFVDGPRSEADQPLVDETLRVAHATQYEVRASEVNRGLAASVIAGVSQVIELYGRAIVFEDDLRLLPNVLQYMNQMLTHYESDERVFQIAAFGLKVKRPAAYMPDVYFHTRPASWGWATWADRWHTVDWSVADYDSLARNPLAQWRFNRIGSDAFGMLKAWHEGRSNSWAIRFTYEMYRQHRYAVTPVNSLTRNEGFGADATNCTDVNFYAVQPDDGTRSTFVPCQSERASRPLSRQAAAYSSLWSRFVHGRKLRTVMRLILKIIKVLKA